MRTPTPEVILIPYDQLDELGVVTTEMFVRRKSDLVFVFEPLPSRLKYSIRLGVL